MEARKGAKVSGVEGPVSRTLIDRIPDAGLDLGYIVVDFWAVEELGVIPKQHRGAGGRAKNATIRIVALGSLGNVGEAAPELALGPRIVFVDRRCVGESKSE